MGQDEYVPTPWATDDWPRGDDGIQRIDCDELQRTWDLRTGRANIARNWSHFGDVLDPAWLTANHGRLDDDVAMSLWVDLVCFRGTDDLTAQADVLTPRIAALWEEGEPPIEAAP